MQISNLIRNVGHSIKTNAPELLTAVGVSGVFTTSYLTARASFAAAEVLEEDKEVWGAAIDKKQRFKEQTALVWKLYIPAAASGAVTVACIVGANKSNSRRTAAAVTAYSITEKAFTEYRERVIEEIGETKEQRLRDELAQKNVEENPPSKIIVTGRGEVLCCELYTGRYFKSDMETLRKAQNDINAKVVNYLYVTLDEFYDLLDLPHTSTSVNLGWDSEKLMELEFSTTLSENNEPCLAFDYNYIKPL